MTHLPEFLQPFQSKAKEYISKGRVYDIEFSGTTYQVLVKDLKTDSEVWAFLQLDSRGIVKDCFCSCEKENDISYCEHLAAAFLAIYNNKEQPLHQRFQSSLWYQLCRIYSDQIGGSTASLQSDKPGHYASSSNGNVIFDIQAKNEKETSSLQEIFKEKESETEETSLKFSNLSEEELELWREGRPSSQLQFELSFWNELAHHLMMKQEHNESPTIDFKYSEKELPNQIIINFADLQASFFLSENNLPSIIPTLENVNSPLKIFHPTKDAIDSITYDEKNGIMTIHPKKNYMGTQANERDDSQDSKGIHIDKWIYIPKEGFYSKEPHELLSTPTLSGDQLEAALNDHAKIIQPLLKGTSLYLSPLSLSYSLSFDPEWNMHISAYALLPGDLQRQYSKFFKNWIYIEEVGFYPIGEAHFHSLDFTVSKDDVSDFVRQERSWLNLQEGFHAYLSSIEAQLSYTLSPQNRLSFHRLITNFDDNQAQDFGAWVYVAGQGFYSKVNTHTTLPLQQDIAIKADQIPLFIRMNRSELHLIPHFFAEKCPVYKSGLKVELSNDNLIHIIPNYELLPEYHSKDVRFFDDLVYVANEGFSEIPLDGRLPERYHHHVIIDEESMPIFLSYELNHLKHFITKIDPGLIKPLQFNLAAENIEKEDFPEKGWYNLKLKYHTEQGYLPFTVVWNGVKQKKRFLFTQVGLLDLSIQQFDWIRHIPKNRLDKKTNTLKLSTLEVIRLNALEEIILLGDDSSNATLKELTDFHSINEPTLTGLKSQLRPYQYLGTRWLWFLYSHGLSGLLCDDMGLGKTHQAMALMASIYNYYKNSATGTTVKPHFLIACPTSVIYHWQEKLADFLPGLKVYTFYGANRDIEVYKKDYDILLTSFGILRLENDILKKVDFELAVYDEIQIAKNQNSRIHYSLKKINAKVRIGMSGTPIENQLRELKSLFDIVLPTYMPNEKDYRELFVKPIERSNDTARKMLLTRFIKPFILRRKKEDVLIDLPEKTEEISHCSLLPTQLLLYNQLLQQSRQRILEQMKDKASSIPYMHIFALLSGLKQICNHPAAFLKVPEEYNEYESGKWELFKELLNEARESQQKVVLFTQYLAMLDILEDYLTENGIGYASIRGATINRGEQVHRFNNDPKCEIFLGSLQASGLGLDLTGGSVVIHYDRWWNAARENQATDRVHRIGQTRGVQVFKLVTKGTFEERIDALISKKGRLMEDIVGTDDHRFLKRFNRDEILQLLQDVEEVK